MKRWFGTSRYVFNQALQTMQKRSEKPSWISLKKEFTEILPAWAKETPFQIKGIAIKDAVSAYWSSLRAAKKAGRPARFHFRSRKEPFQSIFIPKSAIKAGGVYVRTLGELKYRERLPDVPLDSRMVYRYGNWYLMIPYKSTRSLSENQGRIVALDPGVRTFQTFYSESSCGQFGRNDFGRIARLCFYLDDLISRTSKAVGKRRREMRKAQSRIRRNISNLISEIHFQVANYLVKNFDVILLPEFSTKGMSSKSKRRLRKKSVRAMLTWSHYRFGQRLKQKAFEYGKTVIDVCEAYTSKTVSWTGEVIEVGGSRVIRHRGRAMDRDLNGARNIFIRSLVDSPTLMSAVVNEC